MPHLGAAAGGDGTTFGGGNMNGGIGGENDQAGLQDLVIEREPSRGSGAQV